MCAVSARATLLLCLAAWTPSCGDDPMPPPPGTIGPGDLAERCTGAAKTIAVEEQTAPQLECDGQSDEIVCLGQWAAHCDEASKLSSVVNCHADERVCVAGPCDGQKSCDGCRACRAQDARCGPDGARSRCKDDGSGFEEVEPCDEAAGQFCSLATGSCEDLCANAVRDGSYVGCEYWAVGTRNSQLPVETRDAGGLCRPFSLAVVISNPQGVTAEVTIDAATGDSRTLRLAPADVETVELPCDLALKGGRIGPSAGDGSDEDVSILTAEVAAHHIRSNVPVTVYQFNPLEFEAELSNGKRIYSHTNDASLLLPVHSMTGSYRVLAQPTLLHERTPIVPIDGSVEGRLVHGPGFVTIIGVEEKPTTVVITSSAYTLASADAAVPALAPAEQVTISLERGHVLQVLSAAPTECEGEEQDKVGDVRERYCKVPSEYDLTGTQIESDRKLSVISGHDCAFLPYDRWACDHIEETMLPVEAWGRDFAVSVSEAAACQPTIPNLVRVLSATDGNQVRFSGAVHEPVMLDAGEHFDLEITQDIHVVSSDAVLVGQYLLGQDYEGLGSAGSRAKGDPSMSIVIPSEQWRTSYAFLTPESFTDNYVNLIARTGQVVLLDGDLVQGFSTIEGSETTVARVPMKGGSHHVESPGSVGLVLYGYAPYTSYMLPGGLDVNHINGPE